MANYYKYSANMNDRTYFTSVITNSAGNVKRYFSNVESEIYFGDKEMEDIYQFQFQIDEKVLPIYGYNCYYASELVSGQRLIQGQFILNYTNEQEIKTTLGEIDSSIYETILADEYYPGGGSLTDPIYNKLFDIMIGYGYYNVKDKETYNATCQTIVGVKISGMQKVIDSTGQPIMEVYSFYAKDFIEENISEITPGIDNGKDKDGDKDKEEKKKDHVYSDAYNDTEMMKNEQEAAKNEKCLHFVHTLSVSREYQSLELHVGELKGADVVLKEVTVEITEKMDTNMTIPVFTFSTGGSMSKGLGSHKLEKKYFDAIINHTKGEDVEKIQCDITYTVSATFFSETKEYKIKYDNTHAYIRNKL